MQGVGNFLLKLVILLQFLREGSQRWGWKEENISHFYSYSKCEFVKVLVCVRLWTPLTEMRRTPRLWFSSKLSINTVHVTVFRSGYLVFKPTL